MLNHETGTGTRGLSTLTSICILNPYGSTIHDLNVTFITYFRLDTRKKKVGPPLRTPVGRLLSGFVGLWAQKWFL
jgi:hypothetical protein